MNYRKVIRLLPGLLLVTVAAGCIEREGRPVNPCTNVTIGQAIQVNSVDKVDLLFMVDNSNSMVEEQASLAAEFESMIRILTTGDFDQDGALDGPDDFEAVKDLNVGIITSDMGVGGFTVPTCEAADFGDDGVLRTQGRTDMMGCMPTYPSFLNFRPDSGEDAAQFAQDVACVATVGTGGCGFEQQLEAVLKAVSPSAPTAWTAPDFSPPTFHQNTRGHADVANAGFVRENSVLAIIPVTDEEDCSAADPEIFNPSSPTYGATDLNLRCWAHGDMALHPISRYVEGLLDLRLRPNLLIYAPITGVPTDLAQMPGQPIDWDRLVGPTDGTRDERMVERPDPTMPSRLTPSCNEPGRGIAFPPVRIVRVARELEARGAGVTVQSICQASYANALREIIRQIASALGAACLPRQLNVEADGTVACDVVTVMPEGMGCDVLGEAGSPQLDSEGNPVTEGENNRAVCTLNQLVPTAEQIAAGSPPDGAGWYYDYFTGEGFENCGVAEMPSAPWQRIAFTTQPPSGAEVRLECFQSVQGGGTETEVGLGTFCDPASPEGTTPADPNPCGATAGDAPALDCDPVARTCGVPCQTDAACREAGLVGFVCDTRPLEVVDESGFAGNADPYNFCVNPTCG